VTLHQIVQRQVASMLPSAEVSLEHRFPSIGRIADVAWLNRRIIFEIQCSSIDPDELISRIHDYGTLGYALVWVLSDQLYNQPRLSQIEWLLQSHPHYYCNAHLVYDQWQMSHLGARRRGPPLPIALNNPIFEAPAGSLRAIQLRGDWPLHFEGDLAHRCALGEIADYQLLEASQPAQPLGQRLRRGYKRWLHRCLAKLCVKESGA
jgi:competence protein CoiA